ncbi:MAG: pyruvate, phosphate dikinase [Chitinivibrionales bacterium]|nr:pyruvate, phosphate dikinase [Chitinivibrionales bacterium]
MQPLKKVHTSMSTGLKGLDQTIHGVLPGDNIVFQVDNIDDYIPFVHPFCYQANRENRSLIYFRFADHPWLLPEDVKAEIHQLHPEDGFETFISEIFDVIERQGLGACYVFDSLSELSVDWYSDRMLGNFFMLTCPYLYDFKTATYFALQRDHHMTVATQAIHTTAQVVLDVYCNKGTIYIHPLKVWKRYSPTMFMLHARHGDKFRPVTGSTGIAEIMGSISQDWLDFSFQNLDVWTRTFGQARECLQQGPDNDQAYREAKILRDRLLRMAITRDNRLLELAQQHFDLIDLVEIGKRMIGTGLIGGKSVGMLLARAILRKNDPRWKEILETHDSFFIGSDLFYSYLITNGCWWLRRKLKLSGEILDGSEDVQRKILSGTFPDDIKAQFSNMLDYFGQSPIIVRSSSLLEDAYGNAFSGKYESVFCANQGSPPDRLEEFMDAVRTVYASTMRKEALAYRKHWGLLDQDEQMALLVQRVSGDINGTFYYPHVAGVGFSFNPYAWSPDIDPGKGMLRLVFGLGTHAVDRVDDDYTRIVALNAPDKRPESNFDQVRKYAQRRVDVLDLKENRHISHDFENVAQNASDLPLDIFASRDEEMERRAREHKMSTVFSYVLTFDKLLKQTDFVSDMRSMLQILQKAYNYPVDIEFTANFVEENLYRINLVQCRPFQVKGEFRTVESPGKIAMKNIIFQTRGPIIGNSISDTIERLVYVVPSHYTSLSMNERYSLARVIGKLTHLHEKNNSVQKTIALIGPGRWGTTSPSLGVPVSFTDINTVSVLCELAFMHEGLIPDVSLGTHFFNDLVEMDMLYLAIYPKREGHRFNENFLMSSPNRFPELLPDAASWSECIRVIDFENFDSKRNICLNVNALTQEGVCYIDRE